jgi:hypothetical protein
MENVQPPEPNWELRVFPYFTTAGWILILTSFLVGLLILTPTALRFFGDNSTAARDAAQPGSTLLGQLQLLEVIPRWLVPLSFLGVAAFVVGIALEFSAIPARLRNRAQVLGLCFPVVVRLGQNPDPMAWRLLRRRLSLAGWCWPAGEPARAR